MGLVEVRLGIVSGAPAEPSAWRASWGRARQGADLDGRAVVMRAPPGSSVRSSVVCRSTSIRVVSELVDEIAAGGPAGRGTGEAAIDGGVALPLEAGRPSSGDATRVVLASADRDEGLRASRRSARPSFSRGAAREDPGMCTPDESKPWPKKFGAAAPPSIPQCERGGGQVFCGSSVALLCDDGAGDFVGTACRQRRSGGPAGRRRRPASAVCTVRACGHHGERFDGEGRVMGRRKVERYHSARNGGPVRVPLVYLVDWPGRRASPISSTFPGRRHAGASSRNQVRLSGPRSRRSACYSVRRRRAGAYTPRSCDACSWVEGNASMYPAPRAWRRW